MAALTDIWPLYGLRLRQAGLELRLPREPDLAALAELAAGELHDPKMMPFTSPWTDASADQRRRSTLQWHWKVRGEWTPEDWTLSLVAVRDDVVVGTQDLAGRHFEVTREVSTGSWVGAAHQGRGVATAMRRAVLTLAFGGLGALAARSGAFFDNPGSLRVSEKLGYATDGTETRVSRGRSATVQRLVMTRQVWDRQLVRWPKVEIDGLERCLPMFGIPSTG